MKGCGDVRSGLQIALPAVSACLDNYVNALTALGAKVRFADEGSDCSDFNGLLLPGGTDVNPERYGRENTASEGIDDARDSRELFLIDRFVRAAKPVFGICRGQQILNVYFSGTLIQHLEGSDRHSRCGRKEDSVHDCAAARGSFLARLYGTEFVVNSAHHQAVERIGDGLMAVAWEPEENQAFDVPEENRTVRVSERERAAGIPEKNGAPVIEALCHESLPVWSVQWHPERMCFAHRRPDTVDGSVVLRFFLEQCQNGIFRYRLSIQ